MPRVISEFAEVGIEIVPAPTFIPTHGAATFTDFVPGIEGLYTSYYATYEILANLVRRITVAAR